MNCHAGLATVTLIYNTALHWTCNLFSLMNYHVGLAIVRFIYSRILQWTCNLLSLMTYPTDLARVRFIYSRILHWTCNLFSLMTCYVGLATVRFIYSKIWSRCPFLHCRNRNEEKQKGKKKNHEPAAKKKIQHSARGGGQGINVHKNISFWVVGFLAYCPIQFWRGLGILYVVQQIGTLTP